MDWINRQIHHFQSLENLSDRIWEGLLATLQLTTVSSVLAFVVAVVLGLMAGSTQLVLRVPARVIIEFFRGISLLVLLFFVYYVLPLFGVPLLNSFLVGVAALSINYGAYGAEVVRASLTTVPKGQWEATVALSMSWPHKVRRIIFPQAWALMLPSLNNLLILMLKGSAIVYVVGFNELTFELSHLRRSTDIWFSHALVGLALYFTLALGLTLVMQAFEVRAKNRLGRGPSLRETLLLSPKRSSRRLPPFSASANLHTPHAVSRSEVSHRGRNGMTR